MFGRMKAVTQAVLMVGALGATVATAEEGTRVEIRMAPGTEVDPQKLVEAITVRGDERLKVKVVRQKIDGANQLTLDLWGNTLPAAEIPSTLRAAFPQLASATVTVGVSPSSAERAIEAELREHGAGDGGVRKLIIKKELVKEKEPRQ